MENMCSIMKRKSGLKVKNFERSSVSCFCQPHNHYEVNCYPKIVMFSVTACHVTCVVPSITGCPNNLGNSLTSYKYHRQFFKYEKGRTLHEKLVRRTHKE